MSPLVRDATPHELIEAAARNHTGWFTENATVAGGETQQGNGMTVIYSPASVPDAPSEVILAFPRLTDTDAGDAIDAALLVAREKGAGKVGCWSLLPTEPADLAARMVARGFQWGWQPHWMALDLAISHPADFPIPDGLTIRLDDASDWDVGDLPYYDRADAARFAAHARRTPRSAYHFGAWLGGEIVGHCLLYLSDGPDGVAGLYAVGVTPGARNQGVGRAVSLAACEWARSLGCRYVLLNAATHIYERLGFVSLGRGQTWWMFADALNAPPPPPARIAFTEAIARGDTKALDALPDSDLPPDLDDALLCKMTPLEVAARFKHPNMAEQLLALGASPDLIPLCDLGWRDRIPALLAARPDLANRRVGEHGATPLHEAVNRDDAELARWILSANPDTGITDASFHATALGWARHLGRQEILRLLEAHDANPARPASRS